MIILFLLTSLVHALDLGSTGPCVSGLGVDSVICGNSGSSTGTASGIYSGSANNVSGNKSASIAAQGASIQGTRSLGSGNNPRITGQDSVCLGGTGCTIGGDRSALIASQDSTNNSQFSLGVGHDILIGTGSDYCFLFVDGTSDTPFGCDQGNEFWVRAINSTEFLSSSFSIQNSSGISFVESLRVSQNNVVLGAAPNISTVTSRGDILMDSSATLKVNTVQSISPSNSVYFTSTNIQLTNGSIKISTISSSPSQGITFQDGTVLISTSGLGSGGGSGTIGGSGTAGNIAKFFTSTSVVNSVMFENASKIGIGTIQPTTTLEVSGNVTISSGTDRTVNIPQREADTTGDALTINSGNGGNGSVATGGVGGRLTIQAGTGGIDSGTGDSGTGGGVTVQGGTGGNASGTDIPGNGGDVLIVGGTRGTGGTGASTVGRVFIYSNIAGSTGKVILGHNGTSAAGNVGVATSTPHVNFEVSGVSEFGRGTGISTFTAAGILWMGAEIDSWLQTSAQLQADTPAKQGALAYNTTNNCLCASTGTTKGAWALIASSSAAHVPISCW